jgi:hypothetical protein
MGIILSIRKIFRFTFGSKFHLKHKPACALLFNIFSFFRAVVLGSLKLLKIPKLLSEFGKSSLLKLGKLVL